MRCASAEEECQVCKLLPHEDVVLDGEMVRFVQMCDECDVK